LLDSLLQEKPYLLSFRGFYPVVKLLGAGDRTLLMVQVL